MAEKKTAKTEEKPKKPAKKAIEKAKEPKEAKSGVNKEDNKTADQADTKKQEVATAKAGGNPPKPLAKAGKRSVKAIKETEEKQAKEQRKAEAKTEDVEKKPKKAVKPTRPRLERRSKGYRKSSELVDKNKQYAVKEAAVLVAKTSSVKFDATVELHVNLNLDPRHADQNIRGSITMPAGTGKNIKIAVLAEADDAKAAKQAGADQAGLEEITDKLDKEVIDFDVLIAVPQQMAKLAKYARLLGPKGLMPNPKSGTVTKEVAKAVKEAKAGRVEYRVDSTGIVHLGVGKISFGAEKLQQNLQAVLTSIKQAKPASVKGTYVNSIYVTSTMGPSIRISASEIN